MNQWMRWVLLLVVGVLVLTMFAGPARAGYVSVVIDEISGDERSGWPIQVGVPIPEDAPVDELWLARVGEGENEDDALEATLFQVMDVIEAEWFGPREPRDPIKAVEIAFLADLPADATVTYRLYYGAAARDRSPAEPTATLAIETDEGLARHVDTGAVRFGFHHHSGQLLSYEPANTEYVFNFAVPERLRPVHHNPDAWAPPSSWGHASGWDIDEPELAPEHVEAQGPIAWRFVRTGELPRSNGVETTVTYAAFAGMPFLLESSEMRYTRNTAVNAIRNNELVFSRGLHTHGLYIDHDGQTHAFRAFDPDEPDKRYTHLRDNILPPDTPLMALFSDTRRYGIGMVTLTRNTASSSLASAQADGAHYYFNDGMIHRDPDRNFLYFSRAEVFNYAWDTWNTTVVPAGAVYAETSAILVFEVGEDEPTAFDDVSRWTRMLRHPPRVRIADGVRSR